MAKKIREQSLSLSSYLKSVNSEDISENQDVQRMFCWDNAAINELIVTVLTEDYIPPIILGEEELSEGLAQQYIVDGIQRTTALNKFRHMNWKTTKSFENSVIQYQAKRRDEEGHLMREDDGSIIWDLCEFDIRNKTFEQLPNELKKRFDDYQIRIAIHQNCTMQEISKLVRRYNRNKSMGSNQKALTWIPTYARKIKNIVDTKFYKNTITYSETSRKNGVYEQLVSNSVMTVFHMNDWKKTPKDRNEYLESNSSQKEFETIAQYGERIFNACEDKFQDMFAFKDVPIWFAVFDKFDKTGLTDNRFADFLTELKSSLHSKMVNGTSYDMLTKEKGTSDKRIVNLKIDTYITLMNEYLHIKEECCDDCTEITTETENKMTNDEKIIRFIKEDVQDFNADDLDLCIDMLDDLTVNVDNNSKLLNEENRISLLALVAYSIQEDIDLEDWMVHYFENNNMYARNQRVNYIHMKQDLKNFTMKGRFHDETNNAIRQD